MDAHEFFYSRRSDTNPAHACFQDMHKRWKSGTSSTVAQFGQSRHIRARVDYWRCRHSLSGHPSSRAEHGHSHHDDHHHNHHHQHDDVQKEWGPIRRGVHAVLDRSGLLFAAEFSGHSVRASVLSCVSLACCFLTLQVAGTPNPAGGEHVWRACSNVFVLATFALSGVPAFVESILQVLQGKVDTHVLMCAAVVGTVVLGMPLEGAGLLALFHVSHALEEFFTHTATASLSSLVDAVPQQATVLGVQSDGRADWARQVPTAAASVSVGALIAVKPGEVVPLDGVIMEGGALVGQENITGESLPVPRSEGESIQAGSLVYDGTVVVRTTRTSSDSAPARIARLTLEASRNRPRLELFLSSITGRWSAAVLASTVVAFAAFVASGVPIWGAAGATYRSLGILTAAAPCALVVAPLAYVCALTVLTRHGILVKGSHVIDAVRQVKCVALDKTGTISKGHLQLAACHSVADERRSVEAEAHALGLAAAMSLRSQHPVCAAVLQHRHLGRGAASAADDTPALSEFGVVAGAGMWARRPTGEGVMFGSYDYVAGAMSETQRDAVRACLEAEGSGRIVSVLLEGMEVDPRASTRADGSAGARAAEPGQFSVTVFVFSDVAEADSKAAIAWIRMHGRDVMILTGDNMGSAAVLAEEVGVSTRELRADLSPQDKASCVVMEQRQGRAVMMVGDGINDSPALAAADVGVAIASSTDSTVTGAASVVILREGSASADSFRGAVGAVVLVLHVAWATRRVVIQNLAIALSSIILAAVPAAAGLIPLWLTVLVHEGSTVLVAMNCMRLLMLRHPLRAVSSG